MSVSRWGLERSRRSREVTALALHIAIIAVMLYGLVSSSKISCHEHSHQNSEPTTLVPTPERDDRTLELYARRRWGLLSADEDKNHAL